MDAVMFVLVNAIHVPQKLRGETYAEYQARRALSNRLCRMVPEKRERALVARMREIAGNHQLCDEMLGTLFEVPGAES